MRLEVRRANLDNDLRDLFEQYGEQVVAMALALGSKQGTGLRTHPVAPTHAMSVVHANQDAAAKWLTERRDSAERRETIGMIMNAALLVFIAWTILLGVINLFRGVHWAALPKIHLPPRSPFRSLMAGDSCVALRRYDAELGQMRPQGIDQLGALANSRFARGFGFFRRLPDIQRQLDEGHARFTEFQQKLDEQRGQSGRNAPDPLARPRWAGAEKYVPDSCAARFELRSQLIRWWHW
jgi:hypothetical protein